MIFKPVICAVKCAPKFWYNIARDLKKFISEKAWRNFNCWGLHLYTGKFGSGKTISAVKRAYELCCKYRGVTVLTNLELIGFPEDTKVIHLESANQILDLPDKSIVLIDEIGSATRS